MAKPVIDFQILDSYDPRVLLIADNSIWEHTENKPSIIEITTPGASEPVVHYFKKNQINSFNSVNLLLNCESGDCQEYEFLPDGVYEITVKASPDTFFTTKKYLQTAKTRLELDKKYVQNSIKCENLNDNVFKYLEEVYTVIRFAEANTRLDNICEAQELLFKAQSTLEKCDECRQHTKNT